MAIIFCFIKYLTQAAVVASLGASTFLAFAVPHGVTARPKKMIGGYIIGIICGILLFSLLQLWPFARLSVADDFVPLISGAIAVGFSTFLMTVTSTEHPPAVGVALGFAVGGWTWETISFILLFAIILSAVKRRLHKHMINLF